MEIMIGKDIRNYKVKDIGPFSLREAGGIILMVTMTYLCYFLQKAVFGSYTSIFLYIAALPGICLGFIHPYGIVFEKFVKTLLVENFLSPKVRVYESDTEYDLADFLTEKELQEYMQEEMKKPTKVKFTEEQKKTCIGYK